MKDKIKELEKLIGELHTYEEISTMALNRIDKWINDFSNSASIESRNIMSNEAKEKFKTCPGINNCTLYPPEERCNINYKLYT